MTNALDLASHRPLRATASRVGNSLGGLSPKGLPFPDGSPVRAGVPATVEAVGIERDGMTG